MNVRLDVTEILSPHVEMHEELTPDKLNQIISEITSVVSKVFVDQKSEGIVMVNLKIFRDKNREFETSMTSEFDPETNDVLFTEINKLQIDRSKKHNVEFRVVYMITPYFPERK